MLIWSLSSSFVLFFPSRYWSLRLMFPFGAPFTSPASSPPWIQSELQGMYVYTYISSHHIKWFANSTFVVLDPFIYCSTGFCLKMWCPCTGLKPHSLVYLTQRDQMSGLLLKNWEMLSRTTNQTPKHQRNSNSISISVTGNSNRYTFSFINSTWMFEEISLIRVNFWWYVEFI